MWASGAPTRCRTGTGTTRASSSAGGTPARRCTSTRSCGRTSGKSFGGAKLLAIWASGEASREIFDQHHYTLFTPPLAGEAEALEAAAKVALLLPGDCVLFSGGNAHMAMSVSDELSATAYESFVNLHPANLRLFLDSGTPAHYRQCRTRRSMLEDIKTDVAESCADLIDDVRDGIFEGDPLLAHAGGAIELLRSDDFVAERIDERHRKRAAAASAGDGDDDGTAEEARGGRRWRRRRGRRRRRRRAAGAEEAARRRAAARPRRRGRLRIYADRRDLRRRERARAR